MESSEGVALVWRVERWTGVAIVGGVVRVAREEGRGSVVGGWE